MANLYIYLAISQFFSRHLFCYIASCKAINRFYLYQVAASACGIVYLTVPLATSVNHLLVIFIAIGLLDGGLYGISPLLVTESVDETEVPQAWGLLNTTTVFSAVGPFLAGTSRSAVMKYYRKMPYLLDQKPHSVSHFPRLNAILDFRATWTIKSTKG